MNTTTEVALRSPILDCIYFLNDLGEASIGIYSYQVLSDGYTVVLHCMDIS